MHGYYIGTALKLPTFVLRTSLIGTARAKQWYWTGTRLALHGCCTGTHTAWWWGGAPPRNESSMLMGIMFFEFQVRYDKGGSEMSFGMFGLDSRHIRRMEIRDHPYKAYCLKPLPVAEVSGRSRRTDCADIEAVSGAPVLLAVATADPRYGRL